MDFPRLVYLSANKHTLVNDQAEFDAAIKAGWYATVPECPSGAADCPPTTEESESMNENETDADVEDPEEDIPEPTREELEEKARELGIGFNGNTKDETLLKKIEEVLAEQG